MQKIKEFDMSKQLDKLQMIVFVLNIASIFTGLKEERFFPNITRAYILDHNYTKILLHVINIFEGLYLAQI
jgi:hypothetical protein